MKVHCIYKFGSTNKKNGEMELPEKCKKKHCNGEFNGMKEAMEKCNTFMCGMIKNDDGKVYIVEYNDVDSKVFWTGDMLFMNRFNLAGEDEIANYVINPPSKK